MNEIEAALERIDDYIESDSDMPPDPETQISILAMTCHRIMVEEFRKVTDVSIAEEAELYRVIEKTTREHVKIDCNGNYTFNIDKAKGEE